MRTAVTIGAYELLPFIELNIRSCRNIFGNSPILIYCGSGPNAPKIKELADRFECSFITENFNRGHWAGDIQNTVASVAFAHANDCELAIKTNQRFCLLADDIPDRFEEVFSINAIELAMPNSARAETIHDKNSKFHSKFPYSPALVAMRASAFDPEWIANAYSEQVRDSKHKSETLTEYFWAKHIDTTFNGHFQALPWLAEPTQPPIYLQKCQHRPSEYCAQARKLGMECEESDFSTKEWSQISGASYQPLRC